MIDEIINLIDRDIEVDFEFLETYKRFNCEFVDENITMKVEGTAEIVWTKEIGGYDYEIRGFSSNITVHDNKTDSYLELTDSDKVKLTKKLTFKRK